MKEGDTNCKITKKKKKRGKEQIRGGRHRERKWEREGRRVRWRGWKGG